jgi:hypothetical protein
MIRRTVWLVITSLVLGPAIGGLTFMVAAGITDTTIAQPHGANFQSAVDYWPLILSASYALGAAPALLAATVMAIATRWLPRVWHRLLVAPFVGALVSMACLAVLLFSDAGNSVDDWVVIGVIGLSGAVAGVACLAIVELFHPWPARPKVAT